MPHIVMTPENVQWAKDMFGKIRECHGPEELVHLMDEIDAKEGITQMTMQNLFTMIRLRAEELEES